MPITLLNFKAGYNPNLNKNHNNPYQQRKNPNIDTNRANMSQRQIGVSQNAPQSQTRNINNGYNDRVGFDNGVNRNQNPLRQQYNSNTACVEQYDVNKRDRMNQYRANIEADFEQKVNRNNNHSVRAQIVNDNDYNNSRYDSYKKRNNNENKFSDDAKLKRRALALFYALVASIGIGAGISSCNDEREIENKNDVEVVDNSGIEDETYVFTLKIYDEEDKTQHIEKEITLYPDGSSNTGESRVVTDIFIGGDLDYYCGDITSEPINEIIDEPVVDDTQNISAGEFFSNVKLNLSQHQKDSIEKFRENWTKNWEIYHEVQTRTNIPSELIAAIHWREATGDFNCRLHDGQLIDNDGVVDIYAWIEEAVDALTNYGGDPESIEWYNWQTYLDYAESYNGNGYRLPEININTPYVWAGTEKYTIGKYTHDGYDATMVDDQPGVYVLLGSIPSQESP